MNSFDIKSFTLSSFKNTGIFKSIQLKLPLPFYYIFIEYYMLDMSRWETFIFLLGRRCIITKIYRRFH